MTDKVHVKIDDHNAKDYPFPFYKYQQVMIDQKGNTGTVVDAEYIGQQFAAPHYTMTYWVKSNTDSAVTEMKLSYLLALNRNRNS